MRIEFNTGKNTSIQNRTSPQFRFIRLQAMSGSGGKINRTSGGTIGKAGDPNIRIGSSENSPYMKNINQALSRLEFIERVLAEAAYQGALVSAARMIQPVSLDKH